MICDRDDMTCIPRFHPNCLHHFILMITESPGCIKATRRWFSHQYQSECSQQLHSSLCPATALLFSSTIYSMSIQFKQSDISCQYLSHDFFFFFRFIIFTFLSSFIFKISQLKIFDKFLIICD